MTKSEFVSAVNESKNLQDLLSRMGRSYCGYSRRMITRMSSEYGVDISTLKGRRSFDVERLCKECGKSFVVRDTKKATHFCSVTCGHRYSQRFMDTEKLSSTMIEKVSRNEFVSWNRGKRTARRTKYTCTQCGKTFEQSLSESRTNRICVCSTECRKRLLPMVQSENLKRQYENGRKVFGGTTKWIPYKGIKVQGTYELRTCKILDRWVESGRIHSWKYSPTRIRYVGVDGKSHNYIIDFRVNRVDGTFYYLETKGRVKENDELKWKAVRDAGNELIVWFLKDIERNEVV